MNEGPFSLIVDRVLKSWKKCSAAYDKSWKLTKQIYFQDSARVLAPRCRHMLWHLSKGTFCKKCSHMILEKRNGFVVLQATDPKKSIPLHRNGFRANSSSYFFWHESRKIIFLWSYDSLKRRWRLCLYYEKWGFHFMKIDGVTLW